MWTRLSLRTRLFLPLGLMFVGAMVVGAILLSAFATAQFVEESAPGERSAERVADALNRALRASGEPQQVLQAFAAGLGSGGALQFRRADAVAAGPAPPQHAHRDVPAWFIDLIRMPDMNKRVPVLIGDTRVGDIVFAPDLSADMYEKWIGFLAIAVSTLVLTVLTGVIAFASSGAAVRPLRELGEGLTRMRQGHYETRIAERGPPEVRRICAETNALASALSDLSHDNRDLMRRLISLQDDERRDLARELHDELGPLLFGIRANTVALVETPAGDVDQAAAAADNVMGAVEAMQLATRRILQRLRPLHIQELGLQNSLQALLRNAHKQVPELRLTSEFDPSIDALDLTLGQTVYRVVQEAITNVLRHAEARSLDVRVGLADGGIDIEVSDDGIGFDRDGRFGRGLTGMRERVRALGGNFQLLRDGERTRVRCRLPLVPDRN